MTATCQTDGNPAAERVAQRLVADLNTPNALLYWADLVASALVGWTAIGLALFAEAFSLVQLAAATIAAFALYRGLCFIHEISHLRSSPLRGFETAWNLVFGVPLLMPSFVYVGVHQFHHHQSTYGTRQDPEYLPFSNSHRMTVLFLLHSILIPIALVARFFLLAPAALVRPEWRRWVVTHASSLSMNVAFRRPSTPALVASMRRWEIVILAAWMAAGFAAHTAGLFWRGWAVWYGTMAAVSAINGLRTLAAHRYENFGEPRSRAGQLADSIDVPGSLWTGMWAPVGLRYHALHHYFPGIPYHNLAAAHRRLRGCLPNDAVYRRVTSPSLAQALFALYCRGKAASSRDLAPEHSRLG